MTDYRWYIRIKDRGEGFDEDHWKKGYRFFGKTVGSDAVREIVGDINSPIRTHSRDSVSLCDDADLDEDNTGLVIHDFFEDNLTYIWNGKEIDPRSIYGVKIGDEWFPVIARREVIAYLPRKKSRWVATVAFEMGTGGPIVGIDLHTDMFDSIADKVTDIRYSDTKEV